MAKAAQRAYLDCLPSELLVVMLSMVSDGASLRNARATSRVLMEAIDNHIVKGLRVPVCSWSYGKVGQARSQADLVQCLAWAGRKWPGLRSLTIGGMPPGSWLVAVCRPRSGCRPLLQRITTLTLQCVTMPRTAAAALAAALPATCATVTVELFDSSDLLRCDKLSAPGRALHLENVSIAAFGLFGQWSSPALQSVKSLQVGNFYSGIYQPDGCLQLARLTSCEKLAFNCATGHVRVDAVPAVLRHTPPAMVCLQLDGMSLERIAKLDGCAWPPQLTRVVCYFGVSKLRRQQLEAEHAYELHCDDRLAMRYTRFRPASLQLVNTEASPEQSLLHSRLLLPFASLPAACRLTLAGDDLADHALLRAARALQSTRGVDIGIPHLVRPLAAALAAHMDPDKEVVISCNEAPSVQAMRALASLTRCSVRVTPGAWH
jgi:hypothetical protein